MTYDYYFLIVFITLAICAAINYLMIILKDDNNKWIKPLKSDIYTDYRGYRHISGKTKYKVKK